MIELDCTVSFSPLSSAAVSKWSHTLAKNESSIELWKGNCAVKKNCSWYRQARIEKKSSGWKKRHYNGLAAAFISTHSCHNMYIFASDGNPSITRRLWDHDGVNAVGVWGAWNSRWLTTAIRCRKPALHPFLSSSDTPQRWNRNKHEGNIKCIAWSKGQLPGVSVSIVAFSSCRWFRWFWPKQWFSG